jgi:hypothetical protein
VQIQELDQQTFDKLIEERGISAGAALFVRATSLGHDVIKVLGLDADADRVNGYLKIMQMFYDFAHASISVQNLSANAVTAFPYMAERVCGDHTHRVGTAVLAVDGLNIVEDAGVDPLRAPILISLEMSDVLMLIHQLVAMLPTVTTFDLHADDDDEEKD